MPVIVSNGGAPRVVVVAKRSIAGISSASTDAVVLDRPVPVATTKADTRAVEVVGKGGQGPAGPIGPPGPAGGDVVVVPAAADLGGHRVVRSSGGFVGYADAYDEDHGDDVLGLTLGAAVAGDDVQVQTAGVITEPSWAWTPEEPIFAGAGGIPTQSAPTDAAFLLVIGFAITATSMRVRIESPIYTDN